MSGQITDFDEIDAKWASIAHLNRRTIRLSNWAIGIATIGLSAQIANLCWILLR